MKRHRIISIAALLACCISGTVNASNHNDVIWGIKASADIELPGKWHGENNSVTMFRPGYGFSAGVVSNIYLGKNFYFEPGVALFYSRYEYKDLTISNGDNAEEHDPGLYKLGVEVPLLFGYTFGFSDQFAMNLFTGPQLRYSFAGEIEIENSSLIEDMESGFDLWGINGQRRFDCSWKIGLGFPVSNFNISFEADFGISDLLKGDMKFREHRLGLGLTYYF